MSSEVSVDVDMLEHLPAKTMLRLVEKTQATQRNARLYAHTVKQLAPLFVRLEELDIEPRFSFEDGDINLSFCGDGEKLKTVWALLRQNGYKPGSHPKKGDTSFYTHWMQEGVSKFWMNFSSTVCKRVQIGTEMKEVPIYETRCDELPMLEVEPAPDAAIESGDIPF